MFRRAIGGVLYNRQDRVPVVRALTDVSIDLKEGDRLALVGHNGSGKTTLLKVMAGILEPSAGTVSHVGKITSTIALGAGMDMDSRGVDNIYKLALIRQIPRREVQRVLPSIVEFSGLAQFIDLPMRTYSAGMVARLVFACTTAFEPDVLILDEWLGAGDADFQQAAAERMAGYVAQARLVVLGTHNTMLVRSVCNKVCQLEAGVPVYLGDADAWFARQDEAAAAA